MVASDQPTRVTTDNIIFGGNSSLPTPTPKQKTLSVNSSDLFKWGSSHTLIYITSDILRYTCYSTDVPAKLIFWTEFNQ